MSAFDVIKYPISEVVTLAELELIPDDIYKEWIKLLPVLIIGNVYPRRATIAYSLRNSHARSSGIHYTRQLRKLIQEYDQP